MNSAMDYQQAAQDYQRIEEALMYLEQNADDQPNLKEVADSLHLSEYHFQRLFSRWVGISPKRFLQYLTKEHAKQALKRSQNLLEAAYQSGLSGPGRLHDLFVNCEAVTPGEYKSRGEGLDIAYGFHPTPFGEALLAVTGRGVSDLVFVESGGEKSALGHLKERWPRAYLHEDSALTKDYIERIFAPFDDRKRPPSPLSLYLSGTNFQIKVWEALLRIPYGSVVSYGDLAAAIDQPKAARAVGSAVGSNPLPVLVPCHRVIRKMGEFGGYRYGLARKKAILGWEMGLADRLDMDHPVGKSS
jgi:AraC family transcriptional regulator of adaptative response/methylated-DNA-[protein]-cysteine methyltransferase